MHLTFASVGGGLHLAILALKIHGLLSSPPASCESYLTVGLQFLVMALCWTRLYWLYVNSLVFFVPFDNHRIFIVDVCAFFISGVAILFTGSTARWLFAGGLSLLVCWIRIFYTFRRVRRTRHFGSHPEAFPRSVDKFLQIQKTFLWLMAIPMVYALGASLVLRRLATQSLRFNEAACFFFLVTCIVFVYRYDPFFPLEGDVEKDKTRVVDKEAAKQPLPALPGGSADAPSKDAEV